MPRASGREQVKNHRGVLLAPERPRMGVWGADLDDEGGRLWRRGRFRPLTGGERGDEAFSRYDCEVMARGERAIIGDELFDVRAELRHRSHMEGDLPSVAESVRPRFGGQVVRRGPRAKIEQADPIAGVDARDEGVHQARNVAHVARPEEPWRWQRDTRRGTRVTLEEQHDEAEPAGKGPEPRHASRLHFRDARRPDAPPPVPCRPVRGGGPSPL